MSGRVVVAGAFGFEAWGERGRAEKTLATATDTANTLVFDLARNLKNVVGVPVSLVKTVLDRATKLQDELTSAGESSVNIHRPHRARRRGCRKAISHREDSLMSRRFIVAMLGLGLALFLIPQVSLAVEDHIPQAITHTKQAIAHGKQGHAVVLAIHAERALTHAEAGEQAKRNAHTEEAIEHLKQAIDEGKKGNAEEATKHAEAALTSLGQAR